LRPFRAERTTKVGKKEGNRSRYPGRCPWAVTSQPFGLNGLKPFALRPVRKMVLCPDTKPSLKGSHAKAQGNALGKRGPSSFISFFLLFSPERAARGMTWDRPSRPFRAKQIRKKRKKEGGCFSLPRALPVGCYVSALRAERIKALRPAAGEENGTVPRYQAEPERLERQSPGQRPG